MFRWDKRYIVICWRWSWRPKS